MAEVIGDLLPLAVGVALSPIPIIVTILLLLTPRARTVSIGFLIGWVAGMAAMTTLVTFVAEPMADVEGLSTAAALITLALGVLVLMLALHSWRQRPEIGQDLRVSDWLSAVDHMNTNRTIRLGLVLSTVIPKNLALLIAAGVALGAAQLGTANTLVTGGIFVAVSSSGVLLPVVIYQLLGTRAERTLIDLKEWLTAHTAPVLTVLLTGIGAILVAMGISGLT
ncbi:MAG: GAP family protein [Nocardioidaceae bacterium]